VTETVEAVLQYWAIHHVPWLPGNSEQSIRRFESRIGFELPIGMRQFYRATDGTFVPGSRFHDHKGFYFFRLQVVELDEEGYGFMFADYLEWSWRYAVDLSGKVSERGVGAIYQLYDVGRKPRFVAATFEDFLRAYIKDDASIYSGKAE